MTWCKDLNVGCDILDVVIPPPQMAVQSQLSSGKLRGVFVRIFQDIG